MVALTVFLKHSKETPKIEKQIEKLVVLIF